MGNDGGMTPARLAAMIDHTFLKAAGEPGAVRRLCEEARRYGFACAMVCPAEVPLAVRILGDCGVRVGAVVGFPLGQSTPAAKAFEACDAIRGGAAEVDVVANLRLLKAAASEAARGLRRRRACAAFDAGLSGFVEAVRGAGRGVVAKLIIETCYLSDAEKAFACRAAKAAGFDFVKTSTGFGTAGATVRDVRLMRRTVGPGMGVKAAGGIRDLAAALALVEAGATRLGCSAGVQIVEELAERQTQGAPL